MRRASVSGGVLSGVLLGLALAACSDEARVELVPVPRDVTRDGWVTEPSLAGGDDATDFVSAPALRDRLVTSGTIRTQGPWSAPSVLEGDRLYALSGYAGLVVVDLADPAAPRLESRLAGGGFPFDLSVEGGLVLALMNGTTNPDCIGAPCDEAQEGRVLLIDTRGPGAPVVLAERTLPGVVSHAYRDRERGALYVVSRQLEGCFECSSPSEEHATVTALDLRDPLTLGDLGQLELSREETFARQYAFVGGRLLVASAESLQVVELSNGPALGASAALTGYGGSAVSLTVDPIGGVARVTQWSPGVSGPSKWELQLSSDGQLAAVDAGRFLAPGGEAVQPVYQDYDGQRAFALSADGRTLLAYDVQSSAAPRLAGSLVLPFAGADLIPASGGRLIVHALADAETATSTFHVALVDAADLAQPVLASELSWAARNARLSRSGPLHFDEPSGTLLIAYGRGNVSTRVQAVDTTGGVLVLGADVPSDGDPAHSLVHAGRIISASFERIRSDPATPPAGPTYLPITRAANFVRAFGPTVARIGDDDIAQLLPAEGDLVSAPGTDVGSVFSLNDSGRWQPRVLTHGGRVYLTRETATDGLSVYGLDVSSPGGVTAGGVAQLPPLAAGENDLDAIATGRAILVPRSIAPETPQLHYDIVDVTDPAVPRVVSSIDTSEGRAIAPDISVDAPWGFQSGSEPIVDGDWVAFRHTEPTGDGNLRHYLDRLDLSNPAEPRMLPPVNVPGDVLAFDAAAGTLLTLDTQRIDRPYDGRSCPTEGYGLEYNQYTHVCSNVWRVINTLTIDGDVATRRGQLLLDETRRALRFAIAGNDAFYVTEPSSLPETGYEPSPSGLITLEHVRNVAGTLERLPSLDVSTLRSGSPRNWSRLMARGNRVFATYGRELAVIDYGVDPPVITQHALPPWGCVAFDVADDKAYCASGEAGLSIIDLGAP